MEIDTEPVYVKAVDINSIRGNIHNKLCISAHGLYPGEIYGAQFIYNIWYIYPRTNRTRTALIVSGINIDGMHIDIYDENPLKSENKKSEKILIKNLPATIPISVIMGYLKGFPQLKLRSNVIYAKERNGDELSPFINGDRLIYVSPDVSPPLPRETIIGGHLCKIWHPSQNNFCKRCATHGHRTNDVDMCEAFDPDCAVVAFRADSNPLSNYYKCTITNSDMKHKSAEHFYQYEFCLHCDRPDIAKQVYDAPSPKAAKQISAKLKTCVSEDVLASWDNIKLTVMDFVLKNKWNSCNTFRQSLMCTEGSTIAEATQDLFWGVGVAPNLAQFTRPSRFLGKNQLGRALMSIRNYVSLNELTKPDDIFTHLCPPIKLASSSPASTSVTVTPLSLVPDTASSSGSEGELIKCMNTILDDKSLNSEATTNLQEPLHSQLPNKPPRKTKTKPVSVLNSNAKQMNTIDNYVTRDSPSIKRRLSDESTSPSSVQIAKTIRTDGDGVVS